MLTKHAFLSSLVSFVIAAPPAVAQFDPFDGPPPIALPVAPQLEEEKKPEDAKPDGPIVEVPRNTTPINPRQVRLHLMDGSVIAGELSVDNITVKTAFGDLSVPIEKIRNFNPGLSSYPEVKARLDKLVEDLGAEDFNAREQAHKDLVKWGLKIHQELSTYEDKGNAERKRHLTEIKKEFDEMLEEMDEFEDQARVQALVRSDTIVTTEFTIAGKILEESFEITSKYGPLTVKLSDVDHADRDLGIKESVSRSFSVNASNLVQRTFKSSGIRVEKGDKIIVRADGQLVMSPWGSSRVSSPEGSTNYGQYEVGQIPGGALCAKVGSSGKVFKVGSRNTIVAKSSGVLQFGIAMQGQYANQGYNFPGQYNVRVKVEPK